MSFFNYIKPKCFSTQDNVLSTGENLPFLEEEYEIATENGVLQMNGRWSDNPIVLKKTWCTFCPMGTMTQGICKLKNNENK